MTTWDEFTAGAPRISEIFRRRHAATGHLCMLGTLRSDGFPRISPVEPWMFEGELWIIGMPGTRKFADLGRDARFTLHTATVDTKVSDGDAKIWGVVQNRQDLEQQSRLTQAFYEESGFDIRGQKFDPCFAADIRGGSSVEVGDGHLDVTIWTAGGTERVVRKH